MVKLRIAFKMLLLGVATCISTIDANAQNPAEDLRGTWVAESRFCEQSILVVTTVEPNGVVRGGFTCKRTAWKPIMGDKVDKNAVKGILTGNRLVMENADGGGFDVKLEGNTLKGTGMARAGGERNSVTYVKQ